LRRRGSWLLTLCVCTACATEVARPPQVSSSESYLNLVHSRIHPIFADTFLANLANLPATSPLNTPNIYAVLEIVLDPDAGSVRRMGITWASGVAAFDVAALETVHRAQPFGQPPKTIVSPDGNVYLRWEFHRGVKACEPANARVRVRGSPR